MAVPQLGLGRNTGSTDRGVAGITWPLFKNQQLLKIAGLLGMEAAGIEPAPGTQYIRTGAGIN